MPRQPRIFVPGYPLHVIQRGHNRAAVFQQERDYRFFLKCLKEAAGDHGLGVHAFVLMTNHIHLLVTPEGPESLAKTLQQVGRRYAPYFNKVAGRSGSLWEGRYRAALVDSERYFLACSRYIELNPLRAGLADDPRGYPWSSFCAHADGEANALLSDHALYRELGPDAAARQRAYRALFQDQMPEQLLEELRKAAHHGRPMGGEAFLARLERQLGRAVRPRPRGRPAKASHSSSTREDDLF